MKKQKSLVVRCAYDAIVPLDKLARNPRNPNRHPPKQIELLSKILAAQGWRLPIVVSNRSGFIVAGHARLEAALAAGATSGPVNYQDFESEAQENAHLIADNKIAELAEDDNEVLKSLIADLGKTSFDLELLGMGDQLKVVLDEITPPPVDDEHAAGLVDKAGQLRKKWRTKLGQVWELGEHRLSCGDSKSKEAVDQLMAGDLAGLCFTSPPYGQQRDYTRSIGDWDQLMQGVFAQLRMAEQGQVLVNLGLVHVDSEWVPYWDGWLKWMAEQGWRRFGLYVWDQGFGLPGDWRGRFAPSHEFIFHFNKRALKPVKHVRKKAGSIELKNGKGMREKDGSVQQSLNTPNATLGTHKMPDSVVRVNRNATMDAFARSNHPATFPIAFPAFVIPCWPGIVYEPFSGSGTTLIACEQLKRKCLAMEIDPGYVAVSLQRWADATGKTPNLLK